MFRAIISPIFRSTRLCYTTSCNTQSSAPEDGLDHLPKHVDLIGIINKPLLLNLVGDYIIFLVTDCLYSITVSLVPDCAIAQESVAVFCDGGPISKPGYFLWYVCSTKWHCSPCGMCLEKWKWDRSVLSCLFNFTLSLSMHHCSFLISIHRPSTLLAIFNIIK